MKNVIKVVFVIIATLVGAGFASGKEIYSFFFVYGIQGVLGIFISSIIISTIIYNVFKICNKNKINTYQEFCEYIANKNENSKIAVLLNNIVNIVLLITFYIMISGFSSFLNQEFGINEFIGSALILLLCYFTFLKNINGLINISNYLIPILIVFLVFISTKNLNIISNYNSIFINIHISQYKGIITSILYASYNCIILIPVLITLKNLIKDIKSTILISIINFILIIILSFSVYNLLLQGNENIFCLEMPIIEIVKIYGKFYTNIYIVMIGISIFTTAISTGCTFLNNCSKNKKIFKRNLILMLGTAFLLSQISFTTLVNLLYPVLGIIGIIEIVLIYKKW